MFCSCQDFVKAFSFGICRIGFLVHSLDGVKADPQTWRLLLMTCSSSIWCAGGVGIAPRDRFDSFKRATIAANAGTLCLQRLDFAEVARTVVHWGHGQTHTGVTLQLLQPLTILHVKQRLDSPWNQRLLSNQPAQTSQVINWGGATLWGPRPSKEPKKSVQSWTLQEPKHSYFYNVYVCTYTYINRYI